MADIVLKGYGGFDKELAYEALKKSAMLGERGMDLRMKYGYIPCDLFNEAVAYDMEYALADWAVAQVAAQRGDTADYDYFLDRSKSATSSIPKPASCAGWIRKAASALPSTRSLRPTARTTTARATRGSIRGSCRTTSRG